MTSPRSHFCRLPCLALITVGAGLSGCAAGGPHGSPWTIRCLELNGPNHAEMIEKFAETLRRTPGIHAGEVVTSNDKDGVSRLYYGHYLRRVSRGHGRSPLPRRMREDLDLLRQLGDSSGRHYFLRALPVRMPEADVGNPAWCLDGVDAVYSLQVAVFEPMGDFWQTKHAAAQYCADLRKEGYEAYYHHGPSGSVVTVGAFGADAVYRGADDRTYYSAEVLKLQQDELLKYNRLNGAVYRAPNEMGDRVPVLSRLVQIPKRNPE